MITKKRSIIASIIILIVAAGIYAVEVNKSVAPSSQVQNENQQVQPAVTSGIKYNGVEGKTALELLKQNYMVKTKEYSGLGEFVVAINGNEPDPSQYYWSFYVNGKPAQVGASQYVTKSGEEIEWRLEKIEDFK